MFPSRPHPKLIQASMYWLCTTFSYTHTLWCCSNTFFSRGNCRIDSWNEREVELNNTYMKWKDTLSCYKIKSTNSCSHHQVFAANWWNLFWKGSRNCGTLSKVFAWRVRSVFGPSCRPAATFETQNSKFETGICDTSGTVFSHSHAHDGSHSVDCHLYSFLFEKRILQPDLLFYDWSNDLI